MEKEQIPEEFFDKRRQWPFATWEQPGTFARYQDKQEYIDASKAAHAVGSRKKWKFRTRWLTSRDGHKYGLIARME